MLTLRLNRIFKSIFIAFSLVCQPLCATNTGQSKPFNKPINSLISTLINNITDGAQCLGFYLSCALRSTPPTTKAHSLHPLTDWPSDQDLPSTLEIGQRIAKASNKLSEEYARSAQDTRDQLIANQLKGFRWGASTSEHQCSTKCTPEICSYARFSQQKNMPSVAEQSDMNLWDNYPSYFAYMKNSMRLNSIRFSIEWALVQPQGPDHFDETVLKHYAQMFICAIKNGIAPLICFHHYTDPCWFIDRNGFETERNIKYFTNFCETVYIALIDELVNDQHALDMLAFMHPRTPLLATFNSPEGYAFKGYREGTFPPAHKKKSSMLWAQKVLKNLCEAHVQVYQVLNRAHESFITKLLEPYSNVPKSNSYQETKLHNQESPLSRSCPESCPKNIKRFIKLMPRPQIGFLKNMHQLDPAHNAKGPMTRIACKMCNMIQNDFIFNFFTTGTYDAPTMHHTNTDAPNCLDFIGINYYSNRFMNGSKKIDNKTLNDNSSTDNQNYRYYPEGIYRAIAEIHTRLAGPLNIPIFWTEGGIATTDDSLNGQRARYYQGYLYAISRALEDGYPVCGYFPWTLADNYEWSHAPRTDTQLTRRFYGLCSLHDNGTTLRIKPGSQSYLSTVRAFSHCAM